MRLISVMRHKGRVDGKPAFQEGQIDAAFMQSSGPECNVTQCFSKMERHHDFTHFETDAFH